MVEVSGITRRFGDRWALRGVTLSVASGEIVALIGWNGSGKTTLLRVLSTVLRPTHGAGRIFGHDLVREAERIRGEIGVLGHSPGLYGDLTAMENLRFAARMLGKPVSPDEIREVLERVSLGGVRDERARGFSAGMQRRLALARLLIQRPRLVLLDEPYASFDVSGIELINTFLSDHQRGGGTAIVATHDLEKGSGVLGRVVELAAGRIVAREGRVAGAESETLMPFEHGSEAASIGERVG